MDWLPERLLVLLNYEALKKIPVTYFLGYLKSFGISAGYAEKIMGKDDKYRLYIKKLSELRERWFNDVSLSLRTLSILHYEAIDLGRELINKFSGYLIQNRYYTTTAINKNAFFYFSKNKGFYFQSGDSGKFFFIKSRGLLKVPNIWLTHLIQCSCSGGLIGRGLEERIVLKCEYREGNINPKLKKVIAGRIRLCNRMADFFKRNKLTKGLYRFAYLYHS